MSLADNFVQKQQKQRWDRNYRPADCFAHLVNASKHSHVRLFQMQASEFVAREQALVLGSAGQGRRRGR